MTLRAVLIIAAVGGAAASVALLQQRKALESELEVIVASRSSAASAAGDALLTAEVDRIRLALERSRSQPARTAEPHIALALSDGAFTLERGEIVLRAAQAVADVPRGVHQVTAVAARAITIDDGILLVPVTSRDSVMTPRTIRVPVADFDAIRPNVRPGQLAFFY